MSKVGRKTTSNKPMVAPFSVGDLGEGFKMNEIPSKMLNKYKRKLPRILRNQPRRGDTTTRDAGFTGVGYGDTNVILSEEQLHNPGDIWPSADGMWAAMDKFGELDFFGDEDTAMKWATGHSDDSSFTSDLPLTQPGEYNVAGGVGMKSLENDPRTSEPGSGITGDPNKLKIMPETARRVGLPGETSREGRGVGRNVSRPFMPHGNDEPIDTDELSLAQRVRMGDESEDDNERIVKAMQLRSQLRNLDLEEGDGDNADPIEWPHTHTDDEMEGMRQATAPGEAARRVKDDAFEKWLKHSGLVNPSIQDKMMYYKKWNEPLAEIRKQYRPEPMLETVRLQDGVLNEWREHTTVWHKPKGGFGAKNRRGKVKYFKNQAAAREFSQTGSTPASMKDAIIAKPVDEAENNPDVGLSDEMLRRRAQFYDRTSGQDSIIRHKMNAAIQNGIADGKVEPTLAGIQSWLASEHGISPKERVYSARRYMEKYYPDYKTNPDYLKSARLDADTSDVLKRSVPWTPKSAAANSISQSSTSKPEYKDYNGDIQAFMAATAAYIAKQGEARKNAANMPEPAAVEPLKQTKPAFHDERGVTGPPGVDPEVGFTGVEFPDEYYQGGGQSHPQPDIPSPYDTPSDVDVDDDPPALDASARSKANQEKAAWASRRAQISREQKPSDEMWINNQNNQTGNSEDTTFEAISTKLGDYLPEDLTTVGEPTTADYAKKFGISEPPYEADPNKLDRSALQAYKAYKIGQGDKPGAKHSLGLALAQLRKANTQRIINQQIGDQEASDYNQEGRERGIYENISTQLEDYLPDNLLERNYKKEYANYQGRPDQKKNRAKRNKVRREALRSGKVKKGDDKDVHHKNPIRNTKKVDNRKSNLAVVSKFANRSDNGHKSGETQIRHEEVDTFKKDIPSGNWSTSTQPGQMSNMRHLNKDDLFNSSESVPEEKLDMLISIIADITQKLQACSQNSGIDEEVGVNPYSYDGTSRAAAEQARNRSRDTKGLGEARNDFDKKAKERIALRQMTPVEMERYFAKRKRAELRTAATEEREARNAGDVQASSDIEGTPQQAAAILAKQKANKHTGQFAARLATLFPTEPQTAIVSPIIRSGRQNKEPVPPEERLSPEQLAQRNADFRASTLAAITPEEMQQAQGRKAGMRRDAEEAAANEEARRAAERAVAPLNRKINKK